MIKNESSPAVYGLFLEVELEGQVLLGLYSLEGEAEAARSHYIALETKNFTYSLKELEAEWDHLEDSVVVRRLAMGQVPSYNFAA
jgi:hypothetical protein